jgi:hypothetical protein
LSRRSSTQTAVEEGPRSTMTSDPLFGDSYLRWLASQIRGEENHVPSRTWDGVLTLMFKTEFIWLVANDDNRIGDGLELRVEFCHQQNLPMDSVGYFLHKETPDPPCSFLEVLIGLSRRVAWAAGGEAAPWAWQLMTNLQLHKMTDPIGRRKEEKIEQILSDCIFRNYSPDGHGGFFPLTWPTADQTKVEVWFQMADYIYELQTQGR